MLTKVKEVFHKSKKRYGAKRIAGQLRSIGIPCSEARVCRLIAVAGLSPKRGTKFKKTTNSKYNKGYSPNLLMQNFYTTNVNRIWTGDIAYVHSDEGTLYLAIVLDLFSRKIVGWSMGECMTEQLVINTLTSANWCRKPGEGVVFHLDRGGQYCSSRFRNNLSSLGFIQSMSSTGNCYDNAITETVFKSLRAEQMYHEKFKTRTEAKEAIFTYIEKFYNRERAHSALGYLTPNEFESILAEESTKIA